MIHKILIANRGEIAVRIIRACKDMGIRAVAIYSEADRDSLHVQLADEAYCVGSALSKDSYLNMNNILTAAHLSGCDAIHPGFGFLSENAHFASLVEQMGLIWIGPNSKVIEMMGNKINARQIMHKAQVPIIAGEQGKVKQVVLQKMELGEPDASGRRSPVPIPGATETIDIDLAIVSVGVSPNPIVPSSIKGLELGRKGTIAVNDNMQSSIPTIYAGGDIVRGGATVILAMGDGRKAAAAMNEQLKN
jgi:hypothetical protein